MVSHRARAASNRRGKTGGVIGRCFFARAASFAHAAHAAMRDRHATEPWRATAGRGPEARASWRRQRQARLPCGLFIIETAILLRRRFMKGFLRRRFIKGRGHGRRAQAAGRPHEGALSLTPRAVDGPRQPLFCRSRQKSISGSLWRARRS